MIQNLFAISFNDICKMKTLMIKKLIPVLLVHGHK